MQTPRKSEGPSLDDAIEQLRNGQVVQPRSIVALFTKSDDAEISQSPSSSR